MYPLRCHSRAVMIYVINHYIYPKRSMNSPEIGIPAQLAYQTYGGTFLDYLLYSTGHQDLTS